MGWREFQKSPIEQKVQNVQKEAPEGKETEHFVHIVHIAASGNLKKIDDFTPADLTGIDLQYFNDLYGIMTGDKYRMTPADAEAEAMVITKGSMRKLFK